MGFTETLREDLLSESYPANSYFLGFHLLSVNSMLSQQLREMSVDGDKRYRIAAAFLLLYILCMSAPVYSETERIPFATGEWPPYVSESLPDLGAVVVLLSAISDAAGIVPEYRFYPWARGELEVDRGLVFATFPYVATEERRKNYDFSDVLFYSANHFVYNISNPNTPDPIEFNSVNDLNGYVIGVIEGSFIEKKLQDSGLTYESSATVDQAFVKLKLGRIDLYVDDQFVLNDAIRRLFPEDRQQFRILPKVYGVKEANYVMVSRKYKNTHEVLEKFNAGLAKIKANGIYDKIVNDHNLVYSGD